MLAAGGGYLRDNTSIEGDLSMMILCEFGNYQPLWRIQTWALERLIAFHFGSGDLRWVLIARFLRWLGAAGPLGGRRVAQGVGNAPHGAADTTGAAARR